MAQEWSKMGLLSPTYMTGIADGIFICPEPPLIGWTKEHEMRPQILLRSYGVHSSTLEDE